MRFESSRKVVLLAGIAAAAVLASSGVVVSASRWAHRAESARETPSSTGPTTYFYVGNPLANCTGTYAGCDPGTRVTGWMTLPNALAPDLLNEVVEPTDFRFNDGRSATLGAGDAPADRFFQVSTDPAGNITRWTMSVGTNGTNGCLTDSVLIGSYFVPFSGVAGDYSCYLTNQNQPTQSWGAGQNQNQPGQWRTQAEDMGSTCVVAPTGLTHWWTGQSGAGDIIGGDHGTVIGTVTHSQGLVGQAFQFGSGHLRLGQTYGGPSTAAITVMAWINTQQTGPAAWQAIFSSTDSSFVHFQTASIGGSAVYPDLSFSQIPSFGPAPTGVWRHVALTARSGRIVVYENGSVVGETTPTYAQISQATNGVLIGNGYQNGRPFPGLIDELQVYNRALSAAEVQGVYNGGSAGLCQFIPDGDVSGLIAAILAANAQPGPDTIRLAPGGRYELTTNYDAANGLPAITDALTIEGNGATIARSATPGTPDFRIVTINTAQPSDVVALSRVSLGNGRGSGDFQGGAIRKLQGTLEISDATIYGSYAAWGGGLWNYKNGATTISNSLIFGNVADDPAQGGAGGGLYNYEGAVTASNSTIASNLARNSGGIFNYQAPLTLNDSSVSGNATSPTGNGGGMTNLGGNVTMTGGVIWGNTAQDGAGLFNAGTATILDATISGNTAALKGGGIYGQTGSVLTVRGTTISGNIAHSAAAPTSGYGGGIFNWNGATAAIANSTIAANQTNFAGGGIYNNGSLALTNATIWGNTSTQYASGLASDSGATTTLANTLLAGNSAGKNCQAFGAPIISGGHNLSEGSSCAVHLNQTTDVNNVNAGIEPTGLFDNGGPTLTVAIGASSPARDAGDDTRCAADPVSGVDQRGVTRPQGARCDIGAFEAPPVPNIAQAITFTSTPPGMALVGGSYVVSATGGDSGNPVVFSSASPACGVAGNLVSFVSVGSCVVAANQAGGNGYDPAPQITQSFPVWQPGAVASVSAGGYTTCAVRETGEVSCWGAAQYTSIPSSLVSASQVSTGYSHACAVQPDGSVACWGDNTYGQTTVPAAALPALSVTAGGYHTCAVRTDGGTVCWGFNNSGQSTVPAGLGSAAEVSAGLFHTCARKPDGSVMCWGQNDRGQGTVPAGLVATQVSSGGMHTCALRTDGSVACWGYNAFGPTSVPAGLVATEVAAGGFHTCAVRSNGTVACWGGNGYNQEVVPAGLSSVRQVTAGYGHTCALRFSGQLSCWGDNFFGQSTPPAGLDLIPGNNDQVITFTSIPTNPAFVGDAYAAAATGGGSGNPVAFSSLTPSVCEVSGNSVTLLSAGTCAVAANQAGGPGYTDAVQVVQAFVVSTVAPTPHVSAGLLKTCALKADGTVVCWGNEPFGVNVVPQPAGLTSIVQVSAGDAHMCALGSTGSVTCWGMNDMGQAAVPAGLSEVAQISAGQRHTCAVKRDGTVACWGDNSRGPTDVPPGLAGVIQVDGGGEHSCALKSDGTATCWGYNGSGQTLMPQGLGVTAEITAGGNHTCARGIDDSLTCWGLNNLGQATVPEPLASRQASAGRGHTCSVDESGTVSCWGGEPFYGQAVVPNNLSTVLQVSAGHNHTCAVQADGSVRCWGGNGAAAAFPPAGLNLIAVIPQTITFTSSPPAPALYGTSYIVSATGGASGNPVTFSSLTPSVCAVGGSVVSFNAAGTCTIAADQAGGGSYMAAARVTQSFAVTSIPSISVPQDMVVEATGPSGAIATFQATAIDPFDASPAVTCSPASGSLFALGSTTVTCTATNASGNSDAGSFTVLVRDTVAPVLTLSDPHPDSLHSGATVTAFVRATDAVGVQQVRMNGVALTRYQGTPSDGYWTGTIPQVPFQLLAVSLIADDVMANTGTLSYVVDNDGIPTVIDRLRSDVTVDLSNVHSGDFNDGITSGTISRPGPVVTVHPNFRPSGPVLSVFMTEWTTNPAYTSATVSACSGLPKGFVLDGPLEWALVRCVVRSLTTSIEVTALRALPTIEVFKHRRSCRLLSCRTYIDRYKLTTGQSITTGSPAEASPDNTEPIHVDIIRVNDDGSEEIIGSYELDPGETVDLEIVPAADGINDEVVFAVLNGEVTVTLGDDTVTVAEGETITSPVEQLPQSIAFDAIGNQLFGAAAFPLNAAASSGLPVSYMASGACSVTGNMLTVTGVGSCSVTASQPGDLTYLAAPQVTHTFSIWHAWSGLLEPVNADGDSVFKRGSTVPLKFQLTGASAGVANLAARVYIAKISNSVLGTEVEAATTGNADLGNVFRYDAASGQYIFNWGTKDLSEGTWQIRVDLLDGNGDRVVLVSLKK